MDYKTFKFIASNRDYFFSNSFNAETGDNSTDGNLVDPNNHLHPIVGGSKEFNIFIAVSVGIAVILLGLIAYKQFKTVNYGS